MQYATDLARVESCMGGDDTENTQLLLFFCYITTTTNRRSQLHAGRRDARETQPECSGRIT